MQEISGLKMNNEEKFVYRPFNGLFWLIMCGYTAVYAVASIVLRKYGMDFRKNVILVIAGFVIICYFIYKYRLSRDKEYDELYYSKVGGFTWWYELPLHLCNINMFLIPLGIILNNRYIQGFAFYIGPVGTMMAILMPSGPFNNCSIFKPRMMGYYFTHFSIFFNCFLLVTAGIYDPQYADILPIVVVGIGLSFIIFCFNMVLRKTGIAIKANYFYTVEPEENKILEFFNQRIPYSFLYLIPVFILFVPYMYLLTFIVRLFQ